MADSYSKLDQALKDLIEAYTEVEADLTDKFGDDDDAFATALTEALETSIESAIDDQDVDTRSFAALLQAMYEATEQLDPSAFDEEAVAEDEEYDEDADYDDLDEDELELDDEDEEDE